MIRHVLLAPFVALFLFVWCECPLSVQDPTCLESSTSGIRLGGSSRCHNPSSQSIMGIYAERAGSRIRNRPLNTGHRTHVRVTMYGPRSVRIQRYPKSCEDYKIGCKGPIARAGWI
ncbi:hypothetical protein CYLTODRAFT_407526 [Cylindrobasidium torrendii FP15055 ss-10]|uniref:Secreted protein n=1 Tax=Cylindrobasidium torrendii FP15055 ss-10 TaxID=1314674 RepID=A0A0D7BQ37_9AGAR|nr:hypothetical protein CYLTODRAFT_407526 [Cylindrobasidium torrendii FP15055 ss-10]